MLYRRKIGRMGAALVMLTLAGLTLTSSDGAQARVQGSQTFTPLADALVSSASPSRNFGSRATLQVDRRPLVRSYLRFRVRGLAGSVESATLSVYVTLFHGRGIVVRKVARKSWTERGITYRKAPRLGAVVASVNVARSGWAQVDVTRLVTGNGTLELALTHGNPAGVISFSSREVRSRAPQLVVTTSGGAADARIGAAGNIACDPASPAFNGGEGTGDRCRAKATSDLLVAANLTAVLSLGDHQYECGGYGAFLQSYDPSWGRVKSITHPVPGNHDYRSPTGGTDCGAQDGSGYFRYFGAAAGEPGKGYYSYDLGAWHMIALNSFCEQVACERGSPQEVWLRQDLAAHKNRCTLAYFHHARFSSSYVQDNQMVDAFWRDLVDAGADVVIAAHDHVYERFAPQDATGKASTSGVREFVVGTGGIEHHPFFTTRPNSEVRNNDTFGFLELTLHAASYDWRFVPEAGKTFTDSGSSTCR
jgi:calcineurin-like phosphoesterase family protein